MGHLSTSWRETTGFFKDRVFEHGVWALGALSIGIGVLPALLGIAALARPKNEPRDPRDSRVRRHERRGTRRRSCAYAGIKGAYISNVFSTVVVERNLIYLCPDPLRIDGDGVRTRCRTRLGDRRGGSLHRLSSSRARRSISTSTRTTRRTGSRSPRFANRKLGWSEGTIEGVLVAACVVALVVVVALKLLRPRSVGFAAVAASAAVVVVAWSLTGQVYAAAGERHFSELFDREPAAAVRLGRRGDGRGVGRRHRPADHRRRRTSG